MLKLINKYKQYIDYLPFIILLISATTLIWTVATTNISLQKRHYAGLIALPIIFFAFLLKHKVGILVLGLVLILGLVGLISYSPAISINTLVIGFNGVEETTILHWQGIFVLWIIIHFIFSGSYYFGILTKEYWRNFKE